MIRKLKAGEVVREGDFYTGNDLPDGDRVSSTKSVVGMIVNLGMRFPIFREIPDEFKIEIPKSAFRSTKLFRTVARVVKYQRPDKINPDIYIDMLSCDTQITKSQAKAYGEWILEIAEAMG